MLETMILGIHIVSLQYHIQHNQLQCLPWYSKEDSSYYTGSEGERETFAERR